MNGYFKQNKLITKLKTTKSKSVSFLCALYIHCACYNVNLKRMNEGDFHKLFLMTEKKSNMFSLFL